MKEAELIMRIQNGDQHAFRELYDLYFDYAIRVATIIMNQHQSHAGDAVQETFIRVYQNIHLYELDRPFKPWFYKILLNECNRILKRSSKIISVEDFRLQQELQVEEDHQYLEYEDLYEAIECLETHQRTPIILKYLVGFKEREIADILEENVNTIKSRLFKGRQRLKLYLESAKEG